MFDTHAHYDDTRFDGDREELLASLPGKGVELVINPGCSKASSLQAAGIAERYPYMYWASGIHPHDSGRVEEGDFDAIEEMSHGEKCVAIGEIGLDYHYDFSPRTKQAEVFRAQMEIADRRSLPVIIHDREAHADCLSVIRDFPGVRGVLHCYSGSAEAAGMLVRLGYYISFTGAFTFKNARVAHEVARALPKDRIMIETDCPYMAPEGHRGKRNDSSLMSVTAARLAEVLGMGVEEAIRLTRDNGKALFGIK